MHSAETFIEDGKETESGDEESKGDIDVITDDAAKIAL